MNKYKISQEDLVNHLKDQIKFIIASSISFDKGFEGEAKRLATTIRVLVHDTNKSSALLTQLNKMNILFYDSALTFKPNNPLPSHCLTMIRLSKEEGEDMEGDYVAPLESLSSSRSNKRKVGFVRWWNRNTVIKDIKGQLFTRRDLILALANKEGGAHVDPELDQAYANLTRFNSLAWKVYTKDDKKDMGNPVPPAIRQIAHEVIKTLKEGCLDLFPNKASLLKKFEEYENHCIVRNKKIELP
jgi:hypothetical protein